MKITIPKRIIKHVISGIMENFPEASSASVLACRGWDYKALEFSFTDVETNKDHEIKEIDLNKAFGLMFTDKWPKGCTPLSATGNVEKWNDWLCQADAIDFDAFVQLAVFGEVIYG